MTTEYPPEGNFCVYSAQMDDAGTYAAQHLAEQCGGLHSGGKQLSELIIFNRALSDEERTEVTQYLQNKWINSRSAELVHRWSFTSDYTDSVGTSHGFTQRWPNTGSADHPTDNCNVSVSDGLAVLVGGNGAGYLNLGTGVVESDNATLEVWVTPGVQPNWAYMFAYGVCDVKSGQNGATANDYNGFFSCSWGRGGTGSNDSMARNEFSMRYNGTSYVNGQQNWGPFVPGVTYHISITFRKDGNNTIVRWMSRNATTGAIMSERTVTATGWTAAQAATEGWYLTLGHNPWQNGNQDSVATYDEVRVWNGILSDDQLQANVLQSPDKVVGGGMENVVIEADRVFDVPTTGGYGYKTDLPVVIGAGAKIRFDTTDYFGKGLRFKAGGIVVPSGNVLDCVEFSDSDNYTATMEDANTILVQLKSTIPYESTWTGGAPSSAADFSNAANWCALGEIMLNSGLTIDLNGHNLSVAEIDSEVLGAVIKNTSGTASTLTTYTGTVGFGVVTDNIAVSKVAVATATWTGAAGDNDVKTPGNWNCYDSSSNLLPGAIPTTDTTVTISDAPEAIASSEVAPAWKWLDLGTVANKTGTLTFNSGSTFSLPLTSNRALQMCTVANSTGVLNVNGGNVTLGNINAPSANVASTVEVNVSAGKLLVNGWVDFGNMQGDVQPDRR